MAVSSASARLALLLVAALGASALPGAIQTGSCSNPLPPGDYEFSFNFGCGVDRTYAIHVPPQASGGDPLPTVWVMHGLGGDGPRMKRGTNWDAMADKYGFHAVYPSGGIAIHGFQRSWNGGECCLSFRDDMAFFRVMRERLAEKLCMDARRSYAWGFSAGGFMSHRLGCEMSQYFTAVAGIGGTIGVDCPTPRPVRAVPVFQFHGLLDLVIAYHGGLFRSVPQLFKQWSGWNGCSGEPREFYRSGSVVGLKQGNSSESVEVVLYTDNNRGHSLPGRDFGYEEKLWAFWSRYAIDESHVVTRDFEAAQWIADLDRPDQLPWCTEGEKSVPVANSGIPLKPEFVRKLTEADEEAFAGVPDRLP